VKTKISYVAIALSYVGAFVGAGFISGQELVQFFIRFGKFGGAYVLMLVAKQRPRCFDDLVKKFFGNRFSFFVDLIINGYLVGGLIIMMSGAGSLLADVSHLPLWMAVTIVSGLILLTILGRGERILKVNSYLVPILIVSTILVTVSLLKSVNFKINLSDTFVIKNPSPMLINPWVAYLLYIGYNAIGAIVALVNIARQVKPRVGIKGGIVGGIIITLLGTLLLLSIWVSYPIWKEADLPIVYILKEKYGWVYLLFTPTILIAMFTVATAYALGISKYVKEKLSWRFRKTCLVVVGLATPIAFLGFSRLLGLIYPFFGIMATLLLIYLVLCKIPKILLFKQKYV
jgi:uncharacterized membrane protein YkvI